MTQQRISEIVRSEQPPVALAKLIEEATGVSWEGWFTPRQNAQRQQNREARYQRARALRALFPAAA